MLIILAVVAWLAYWLLAGRFIESTDDAYLQADSVTMAPKVSGYVAEVLVGDNQAVKAGDPLVRIDARQYQASFDQANATIAARQADIARSEAEIQQQQANAVQAEAQAHMADIKARHASEEVRRYTPLAAAGAETNERLADLVSERDQALAALAANNAAVNVARTQIQVATTQIAQSRAQLTAAQASARQSELDMQDTLVRATIAGRVGDRSVRVGQFVQPGTRMLTVVPVQDVYLVANFKETQLGRMRPGQPATLSVDALPGVKLHGVVDSFAPGTGSQFALLPPENATGNFTKIVQRVPVRIRVEAGGNADRLLPGLSVTVDVETRQDGNHG
ncbi:MAG TPA: HlyD family secretion protein [Bordetella sp.]